MHIFSTQSSRRLTLREAGVSRGLLTGVPLGDTRSLCLVPVTDALGFSRPPLNRTALRLSLELSYLAYTLELEPWARAGWTDLSIQVDNHLESGVTVGESDSAQSERVHALMNRLKLARARIALKEHNPLSQMMGALRQRESSDTVKAVTMLHRTGNGRYVVAIGFMGTGSRFYDWFSNFRFDAQDGFHKGFYQLTQYFEQSADRIFFPATAAELGMPTLTLRNILAEMRSPHSRFSLWMAGHSQGAAVMQVFCHRLLEGWGVLPRHIVGYGFASPTVAIGGLNRDPADYPLYHILNSDDLVPLVGAANHLGVCLLYAADNALRAAAYASADESGEGDLKAAAETLTHHVVDTPSMLEALAAFLDTAGEEKTEESFRALMDKRWSIAPLDKALDKALGFAGGKAKSTMDRMGRYLRIAYRSVAGQRMNEAVVEALKGEMRPVVRSLSTRELFAALSLRTRPPHMLRRPDGLTGAYGYIVAQGPLTLRPFVWHGTPPRRISLRGTAMRLQSGRAPGCCRGVRRPALPSARNRGISAARAARVR